MSQGAIANSAGAGAEAQIANILNSYGYIELDDKQKKVLRAKLKNGHDPVTTLSTFGKKVYAQQLRGYDNIYGARHTSDFVIYDSQKQPKGLIIEVKWQTVGGSVDEKLPFVVLSFKQLAPIPTLLIIDGGGMRTSAVDWAVSQNDNTFTTLRSVGEFARWARKNL